MKDLLEKANIIMRRIHAEQKDKQGQPYYLHPLAVSERVESDEAKIVALLHDTVEDSEITVE